MFGEKEANAYVQKILAGGIEPQTDEERWALQRMSQVTEELNRAQQEAAAAAKRAEELRALANKLAGKREGYIEMLVGAEVRRHATDTRPLSLVDLKDKMGADAIEARDKDGKLIETTEATDDTHNRKPGRAGKKAPRKPQGA